MATDTGLGEVRLFEDFIGVTLDAYMWTPNTDTGTAAITTETENGVMQLYNPGNNDDLESIFGAAIWQPNTAGTVVFEARVKIETSLTTGCFIGLSDAVADEMPLSLDDGVLARAADDAVGFVYDTGTGNAYWHCCSTKAQSLGAQTNSTVGPTKDVYQTFRIVVESNGNCRYFIDGDEVTVSGAARSAAITTTVQYTPCVVRQCNGTAGIVAVDYVYVSQGRA